MPRESPRREFLKSGGAVLTASLVTGNLRGANSRANIAFVGCGPTGIAQMSFAVQAGGVAIAGVCDEDREARERAAEQARRLGFGGVREFGDFREVLADRSIDAVAIAAPAHCRAYLTVEACKAGKDVWCEAPVCAYVDEGPKMVAAARRFGRMVQGGTVRRSGRLFREVRETVRGGALGEIPLCTTVEGGADGAVHAIDFVQSVFGEAMPVAVSAQGGRFPRATFRYRSFVAAFESREGSGFGAVFHGTRATLAVNREGAGSPAPEDNLAHWKNFLECLRTRRQPAGDIESCVRSTTTWLLANLAQRHGAAVEWDEQEFTTKQPEIRALLKARSPWQLEV